MILNIFTSAKSLLVYKVMYSQLQKIRAWTSVGKGALFSLLPHLLVLSSNMAPLLDFMVSRMADSDPGFISFLFHIGRKKYAVLSTISKYPLILSLLGSYV